MRGVRVASTMRGARNFSSGRIGVIGLGKMGSAIAHNLTLAGHKVLAFDTVAATTKSVAANSGGKIAGASSPAEVAAACANVITMLPNDAVLNKVALEDGVIEALRVHNGKGLHISCSTVSPHTARALAAAHAKAGSRYVGAPVFARPDGLGRREASFTVGGEEGAVAEAQKLLLANGAVFKFGPDPGSGNVTKLCGNYLIATTIQGLAEALALAEANGVDRDAVKNMLTSTIFNCLIHKGYGQRVSERDHQPGGFALELGLKDVTLVLDTAAKSNVPMPFGSVMKDQFTAAVAKGRAHMDWSAVALQASENAGVDVSEAIAASCKALPKSQHPAKVLAARKGKAKK